MTVTTCRSLAALAARAALVVIALSACREPLASADGDTTPTGPRYRLVRRDSIGLPLVISASAGDTMYLDAEVITLQPDGIAAFLRTYRRVAEGADPETGHFAFGLWYSRSGASIAMTNRVVCFAYPCPRVEMTGPITEDSLLLSVVDPVTVTYRYARLPAAGGPP